MRVSLQYAACYLPHVVVANTGEPVLSREVGPHHGSAVEEGVCSAPQQRYARCEVYSAFGDAA